MSPPLETNGKNTPSSTHSLGVDSDMSLLSHNNANNDQAMDIFLNQVAEYNNQHVAFEQHQQASSSSAASNSQMNIDPSQILTHQQQQQQTTKVKQEEQQGFAKPAEPPKKGKQKAKETGHSSLLHVFTNPLLHAIPILARNCLNFEDFLAQTSLPGQSLLGPGEVEEDNDANFTSSPIIKSDSPWHIRVLGLPHTGAKSRVETQIKICLQLVDTTGELATNWSHIKLPEHLVAKDKLKRKNQKYGTDEKASLTDNQVLILEAAVVCDGQPDNEIIMCTSCVHRERKRLKRKRDNKVARAANKEGGAAKLAALFANDLPDLSDETIMAEERRRILLFNCNEYVEFNNGEATLPTRVTCYCRHHSEKTGFRIVFTVKDNLNHVIGTGRSPPIMITDDHKSSKMQQAAARKRTRADMEASATESDAPSTSRRKAEIETDSGVSSPVASTPATPSSQIDDVPENSPKPDVPTTSTTANNSNITSTSSSNIIIPANSNMSNHHQFVNENKQHPLAEDNQDHFISQLQQPQQQQYDHHQQQQQQQSELFDFLNSNDLNLLPQQHQQPEHSQPQMSHMPQITHQPLALIHPDQQHQQHMQQQHHQQQQQQILNQFTQNPLQSMNRRRATVIGNCISQAQQPTQHHQQQQQYQNNVYAKLSERNALEGGKNNLPRLHRLIPSEGPIYGGAEVTVLGSNFYEGLTCLFGENPAIPTHCWSANTLLCILPPAASAGPVVVSFKEHPLMLEGQDVVLFTYFDESDRALMELALQVVGLKTMGKVEDARQIAMRIVQGDNSQSKDSPQHHPQQQQQQQSQHKRMTTMAATAVYDNARKLFLSRLEQTVVASLLAIQRIPCNYDYLTLTNVNQHNLLHLATLCGYTSLVETLVKLKCNVDQVDKNGFTALHFASWSGKIDIVKLLIDTSNLKILNSVGKTAERLAIEAGHKQIVQLFKQKHRNTASIQTRSVRIPLKDFIPVDVVWATSLLPTRISNLLSNLYTFSSTTRCVQRVARSAGQVYNFMLDPF
ncbi:hypothetical protein HMPREF1544_07867 [Mucor circinelloides 1006PhL]|uniref:IPT/TIG domain-containing protein n=1 Tax=Mucor circinelloides f. circinelloides (strain 1006PhL) TaxID=1220926 RepID=S2J5C0_MUCC1|nr:hypothetical protein HMPREF1544_07867 [Mucor circinelloides 1006PhL]